MHVKRLLLAAGLLLVLACAPLPLAAFTLDQVEQDVRQDYPTVTQMTPKSLAASAKDDNILLLDVREPAEFAVSHIPGAVRVSPDINRAEFLQRFTDKAINRHVVVYCSVGVRSSQLAEKMQNALLKTGVKSIKNLSGGIFRWHNEGRVLINRNGQTDYVHPYDEKWGRLVNRKDKTRYEPQRQ